MHQLQKSSFKVVLVGDSNVGKTSFFNKFMKSTKSQRDIKPTVALEIGSKEFSHDQYLISIKLWDTAGQEKFRSITMQHFRQAAAALLFYDMTVQTTFDHIKYWIDDLYKEVNEQILIILIGNKLDLVKENKEVRSVDKKIVQEFCDKKKILYIELSLKSGEGFEECLQLLINNLKGKQELPLREIYLQHQQQNRSRCCKLL